MEIKFEFPMAWGGCWDGEGVYIFGKEHDENTTASTINHESIHYVIQKLEGKRATVKFDKMAERMCKEDIETYRMLY